MIGQNSWRPFGDDWSPNNYERPIKQGAPVEYDKASSLYCEYRPFGDDWSLNNYERPIKLGALIEHDEIYEVPTLDDYVPSKTNRPAKNGRMLKSRMHDKLEINRRLQMDTHPYQYESRLPETDRLSLWSPLEKIEAASTRAIKSPTRYEIFQFLTKDRSEKNWSRVRTLKGWQEYNLEKLKGPQVASDRVKKKDGVTDGFVKRKGAQLECIRYIPLKGCSLNSMCSRGPSSKAWGHAI